jgi:hypothetical protein
MATLLIHVENAEGGARETRAFAPGVIRIGRNRLNDLVLPHPAVSQFHAHIDYDGGNATLIAGRATNPVQHNGQGLAPEARATLDGQSAVTLGPITLRFEATHVPVEDPDAAPAWFADHFAWSEGRKVDERAATEGYRPSALRSYIESMLPEHLGGAQRNDDPLAPWVAQWNSATEGLVGAVRARLEVVPAESRAATLHALGVQHPPLRLVPAFRELATELGVSWDEDLGERALLRWRQLGFQYGAGAPGDAASLDALVVRLVRALAALADGFAALRGAAAPWNPNAVSVPDTDANAVLGWLLAPSATDAPRALRAAFGELAAQPARVAGAAVQGFRAVMERWSPFALEQELARLRGVPALDAEATVAVWAHWRELFRWWAGNERALHDAVIGEAAAQALRGDDGNRWER